MDELKECIKNGFQVIDIRSPPSFAGAHIPGTLNIWKDRLTVYKGWMLNYNNSIVLVNEKGGGLDKVVRYLVRIDFDNITGYLAGGFESWFKNAGETVSGDAGQCINSGKIWKMNPFSCLMLEKLVIGKKEDI